MKKICETQDFRPISGKINSNISVKSSEDHCVIMYIIRMRVKKKCTADNFSVV